MCKNIKIIYDAPFGDMYHLNEDCPFWKKQNFCPYYEEEQRFCPFYKRKYLGDYLVENLGGDLDEN